MAALIGLLLSADLGKSRGGLDCHPIASRGNKEMDSLDDLIARLDDWFELDTLTEDPTFSRVIPSIYAGINYDWRSVFESDFCERFNGLMLRGAETVQRVYCSAFPSAFVLDVFLRTAEPGDLLFLHHPLDLRCGDPRGAWGEGFTPIDPQRIARLQERRLSVYTCHIPLDIHPQTSTGRAMAAALGVKVVDEIYPSPHGNFGLVGRIQPMTLIALIERLKLIFRVPYVDFEGSSPRQVESVALVPGAGDRVFVMRQAEAKGAQVFISGEIHHHIDNQKGHSRFAEIMDYSQMTQMALIGVSHAASEFLVMRNQIVPWLEEHASVQAFAIEEPHWWR
jgi:putative NIF3 family GTP cyclohydrolase 1 type 2